MGAEWARLMREAGVPKRYRLRVRERLVVMEYVRLHGIRDAARRFGLDRKTIRAWRDRSRAAGIVGLIPRYPKTRARRISDELVGLIRHARLALSYGSTRTQLWLWRVHRLRVAQSTIQRVVRALKLPAVKPIRKRRPRQLKLFERERPGDCVQVDVKGLGIATNAGPILDRYLHAARAVRGGEATPRASRSIPSASLLEGGAFTATDDKAAINALRLNR